MTTSACARDPDALFRLAKTQYEHGDLVSARANAQSGYRRYRNQPKSSWCWKYKLQWAEMLLDNGRTQEAKTLLAAAPPAEFSTLLPRYQMLKAYALYREHQAAAARDFLKSAKAGAEKLQDAELTADIFLLSGACALQYDADHPRAREEFQNALKIAEERHLDYQRISALVNLGALEFRRERYGNAFPYLYQAVEISRQAHFEMSESSALGNIAACYHNLGELDKALQVLRQAVAIETKSSGATDLSESYSELGSIYLQKGDTVKAVEYLHKALDLVSRDAPVQYAQAAASLARALEETGALNEAEQYNRAGLQAISKQDVYGIADLTLNEAAIAEHRRQHDNAKAAYEKVVRTSANIPSALWRAYASLAAIHATAGDFKQADLYYERALQVVDANRADQLYSAYKITFLNDLIHLYQEYVTLLMKQNEPGRALEVADSSRASVLTEALRGKSGARDKQLAREVQRAAKTSQCLFLFYWVAPKSSYLWATTEKGSSVIELPDKQQIDRDVQSYLALIQERRDPFALSSPAGRRLYQTLIGPVEHLIPKGGRVVVVPDGSLHNLNFETLVVDNPKPHYWLEDVTISVAPSLGILRAGKNVRNRPKALLLMGDPITVGTGFEPLPEAANELAKVQRHFPGVEKSVYTLRQATPEAYGATRPQRFSTIHFATHVEPNEQSPLDSAIILSSYGKVGASGYRLYARDVAEMPLNADLVTISACRGAGTRTLSGEGLVGFAWAFFQAGARNVVTSLWDANDLSTTELMDRFYGGVESRLSYARALRDAKVWMLLHSRYRKPYYWAPFQLYSLSIDSATTAESSSMARVSKLSEVNTIGETGHLNRR